MNHLGEAYSKLDQALQLIDTAWQQDQLVRTPRLAEVVSLLERAQKKLEKEADTYEARQEGKS